MGLILRGVPSTTSTRSNPLLPQVRETSREVFFLVLDVRRYMLLRSVYWAGKKKYGPPRIRLTIEHALSSSFGDIHRVLVPGEAPRPSTSPVTRGPGE